MDVRQRGGGGGAAIITDKTNQLVVDLGTGGSDHRVGSAGRRRGTKSSTNASSNNNNMNSKMNPLILFCAVLVSFVTGVSLTYVLMLSNDYKSNKMSRHTSPDKMLSGEDSTSSSKLRELQDENEELKRQINAVAADAHKHLDNQDTSQAKKLEGLENELKRLQEYRTRMHQEIQKISKRALLDRYGPGPHQVAIEVEYDPESNIYSESNKGGTILIELAPEDEMPAVTYFFLNQVNATIYDGCSFHRNAGHVVQGGPAPNFLDEPGAWKKINKSGLKNVPFQEYSAKFPHKKYTLGYAGRPGGPDFYISTKDNTRNHGPGGQTAYDDASEADPCFAKIIEGIDVVEQMHKSNVQKGAYHHMEHNVAIRSMKLVK